MRLCIGLILCLGLAMVRSTAAAEADNERAPMPPGCEAAAPQAEGTAPEPAPVNPPGDKEPASDDGRFDDPLRGCCDCRAQPYFSADALFLARRPHLQFQPLVVDSDPPNAPRMTTDDLKFNTAAGTQLTLGLPASDDAAWEIGYFGIERASASATVEDRVNNDLSLPGNMGLQYPSDFVRAAQIRADYDSTLHNVELNYVKTYDRFALLAGLRYLGLDEDLNLNSENTITGTSDYHVRATNRLYGAQVGGRVGGECGRLAWTVTGKAGIFGNEARQSNHIDDLNNTFPVRDTLIHDGTAAMVGDLRFVTTYQLTSHWAVRGGYNLIWIENVALAPDQLDFNTDADAGTAIHDRGGLFLYGANVGLEARW
jgi:hypothetical protein